MADGLMIASVARSATVQVVVHGERVEAYSGETVAGLMLRLGYVGFRRTERTGEPRGYFCGMGSCFDCLIQVDGRVVQACMTAIAEGMRIGRLEAQAGAG